MCTNHDRNSVYLDYRLALSLVVVLVPRPLVLESDDWNFVDSVFVVATRLAWMDIALTNAVATARLASPSTHCSTSPRWTSSSMCLIGYCPLQTSFTDCISTNRPQLRQFHLNFLNAKKVIHDAVLDCSVALGFGWILSLLLSHLTFCALRRFGAEWRHWPVWHYCGSRWGCHGDRAKRDTMQSCLVLSFVWKLMSAINDCWYFGIEIWYVWMEIGANFCIRSIFNRKNCYFSNIIFQNIFFYFFILSNIIWGAITILLTIIIITRPEKQTPFDGHSHFIMLTRHAFLSFRM